MYKIFIYNVHLQNFASIFADNYFMCQIFLYKYLTESRIFTNVKCKYVYHFLIPGFSTYFMSTGCKLIRLVISIEGVDWTWAKQSSPSVLANFEKQIQNLEGAGAQIIPFEMPEIPLINVGHLVAITSEGGEIAREHIHKGREIAPDNYVILNAALAHSKADDYILSARYRTRVMNNLTNLFKVSYHRVPNFYLNFSLFF